MEVIITWVHYQLGTLLNSTRDEKAGKNRIEEIIVSNSSLVSGLSEASRVKLSLVEVSQKVGQNQVEKYGKIGVPVFLVAL